MAFLTVVLICTVIIAGLLFCSGLLFLAASIVGTIRDNRQEKRYTEHYDEMLADMEYEEEQIEAENVVTEEPISEDDSLVSSMTYYLSELINKGYIKTEKPLNELEAITIDYLMGNEI